MPDNNTILPIDADEKFATASAEGIPPYNWIPPVEPPLQITQHARKPFLDTNLPPCDVLRAMDPEGKANEEHLAKKDANLKKIPHPFSRFVHLDPPPPNEAALKKLPLRDVETYRRLGLTFNLIVCRTVELLTAINDAVKSGDLKQYQDARDAYMGFIRNLDNHEPKG